MPLRFLPPKLYFWVSGQGAVPCGPCCLLQVRQVQSDLIQLAVACPRNTAHVKQYNSRFVMSSNCGCKVRNRLDLLEVFDVYPSLSLLDSDWQAGPIGSVSTGKIILGSGRSMQSYSLTFSRTEREIFDSCRFTVEKTSISASAVFHRCLQGVSE